MIGITGWRSKIAEEFRTLIPAHEQVFRVRLTDHVLPVADKFFVCQGLLRSKRFSEQTVGEIRESWEINFASIARWCDLIFDNIPHARICIIGSESAYRGSYDGTYATAKREIHRYVETKNLLPRQQLVCISPGIVEDAGMTTRRRDVGNLSRRKLSHPKQRFLKANEVASTAYNLLYGSDFISGTIIRMHGGEQEHSSVLETN